jgi:hypothetical protein
MNADINDFITNKAKQIMVGKPKGKKTREN